MKPTPTHEQPTRSTNPSASAVSGRCQVGTDASSPCGRPAETNVLGIPFCRRCAREQENYFVIGELTRIPRGQRAFVTDPGYDTKVRRSPAGGRRRFRQTVRTGGRVQFLLLALILASALLSAACGGTERARADSAAADPKAKQAREANERTQTAKATAGGNAATRADDFEAVAGDAEARTGRTVVAGKIVEDARGSIEGMDGPQQATLRITGDPGTRFSGACSVGEKVRVLDGRVPERYAFEPGGKKLECEVRKQGGGALGIVFTDGASVRSEQRTGAGESTVRFSYSNGSIVSSTSSVSVQRAVMSSDGSSSGGPR